MPSTPHELISLTTRHALRHCSLPARQGIYAVHIRGKAIERVSKQLQDERSSVPEKQADILSAVISICNMQDDASWWIRTSSQADTIIHDRALRLLETQLQSQRSYPV